ncbi:MAG TPA: DUF4386 domain-containing protein [Rectinemataceae bacterium]|nr:DUF4386 domain-containing protein [Rectinemataceae bacterium]
MNSERKRALITGMLFILATASGLAGSGIIGSSLDGPDCLAKIYAAQPREMLSVVFQFAAAAASAGIAMSLYPVLKRHSEGLALGAVGFRIIEGVFYLVGALGLLALVSLSQDYVRMGADQASQFRIMGRSMLALRRWSGFVLGVAAFCLGASMYYYVFFRTRIVPRWLSAWGLIAVAMLLTMAVLVMFGGEPSGMMLALALPIAVQEMVLAFWLIAKGFAPAAPATR